MTRETKMGLLVGLAFVLVFGILISNHLSNVNEPAAAPLQSAADTVRSGLGQPSVDDVAPVLRAPQAIVPQQPVVINEELKHRDAQPPVRFVAPVQQQGQAITPDPGTLSGTAMGSDHLKEVAQQHGEDIVPAKFPGPVVDVTPPVDVQPKVDQPMVKPAGKTYIAESGDSLGAIALKAYGSSCRANREAIVAANPSLAANRDLIIAGRSYVIPPLGNTVVSSTGTQQAAIPKPPTESNLTYTVKPHDTLWSIAMSEVGTASAVSAIEDLNKDVLNGSDRVRPNMKLVLPAKKTE